MKLQLPLTGQSREVVLDVPFPFYPQKRVATPNQTVKLKQGEELTLDKVIVTPGSTFMQFHTKSIADPLTLLFFDKSDVTVGKKKVPVPLGSSIYDNNIITMHFDHPFYDDPGNWTYTVPTAHGGDPLIFRFTIP